MFRTGWTLELCAAFRFGWMLVFCRQQLHMFPGLFPFGQSLGLWNRSFETVGFYSEQFPMRRRWRVVSGQSHVAFRVSAADSGVWQRRMKMAPPSPLLCHSVNLLCFCFVGNGRIRRGEGPRWFWGIWTPTCCGMDAAAAHLCGAGTWLTHLTALCVKEQSAKVCGALSWSPHRRVPAHAHRCDARQPAALRLGPHRQQQP